MKPAVVAVGHDGVVRSWNAAAEDMWGLQAHEAIGKRFATLDIGLPVGALEPSVQRCATGRAVPGVLVEARNRRGHKVTCSVTCTSLSWREREAWAVVVVMEIAPPAAERGTEPRPLRLRGAISRTA
jgi:PAS domain S-box-containing protein